MNRIVETLFVRLFNERYPEQKPDRFTKMIIDYNNIAHLISRNTTLFKEAKYLVLPGVSTSLLKKWVHDRERNTERATCARGIDFEVPEITLDKPLLPAADLPKKCGQTSH